MRPYNGKGEGRKTGPEVLAVLNFSKTVDVLRDLVGGRTGSKQNDLLDEVAGGLIDNLTPDSGRERLADTVAVGPG
jgi:hypothetical protein